MEIKNSLLKNLDPYRTQQQKASETAQAGAAAKGTGTQKNAETPGPRGDRVTLSSSALLHTAARSAVSATPELRQEKVDAVKERLASGEYSIDAKNIAEKLLRDEAFLAGTLDSD
ncbi:flagellar biosynthesis anti-sigma factor FlgM [Desulfovibrio sp. OttesenSCG-928-A18]|nr:flagellar biosynthesis anti-sigma factor FlgM [Desulfovibrio sp. OttesenSCG-928-A18]